MTVLLKGSAVGSFFTNHDPLYAWAPDISGGTITGDTGGPDVAARRLMTAAGTTICKTMLPIGADWRAVAMRWAWCKEATGSGNVVFQVRYSLWYPLLGQTATAMPLTTIAVPASAVPGDPAGSSKYEIPSVTSAIATPVDGFIGTSPLVSVSVERLGDNGSDTYGGSIGLIVITFTRVD